MGIHIVLSPILQMKGFVKPTTQTCRCCFEAHLLIMIFIYLIFPGVVPLLRRAIDEADVDMFPLTGAVLDRLSSFISTSSTCHMVRVLFLSNFVIYSTISICRYKNIMLIQDTLSVTY